MFYDTRDSLQLPFYCSKLELIKIAWLHLRWFGRYVKLETDKYLTHSMLLSYQYEPERERERESEWMRGRIKRKEERKEMHTYLIYIVFLNLARDPGAIKRKATLLHTPSCGKTNYFFSAQKVVHASNLTFVAISVWVNHIYSKCMSYILNIICAYDCFTTILCTLVYDVSII